MSSSRRPYSSLFDFCERVFARAVNIMNKGVIEALIKSGTFDAVHGRVKRAALCASAEQAIAAGQKTARDKASGQGALFGLGGPGPVAAAQNAAAPLAAASAWTESETLSYEKEVLGFYVSSHPLEAWRPWAAAFVSASTSTIKQLPQDSRVVMVGLVQSVRSLVVKSGRSAGQKMGVITLEDTTGTAECVVFSDAFARYGHLATADSIVFLLGRVDLSRGEPQVMTERIVPVEGVPLLPGKLRVVIPGRRLNGTGDAAVQSLAEILRSAAAEKTPAAPAANSQSAKPGDPALFPVEFVVETEHGRVLLAAPFKVAPTPDLFAKITRILGPQSARIQGGIAVEMNNGNGNGREYSNGRPAFVRRG